MSIYVYNVSWFGSSFPLFSLFHNPLLKITLTGFSVSYSYRYRKNLSHIYPSVTSSIILPLLLVPPLNMTCFTFLIFIVLVSVPLFSEFLPGYFTCKCIVIYSVQTPLLLFFSLPLPPYCSTVFNVFCWILFLYRCNTFQYCSLSFFSSFPPHLASSNSPTFRNIFCMYLYILWCLYWYLGQSSTEKTCDLHHSSGLFP
jgi:hypothetical protein